MWLVHVVVGVSLVLLWAVSMVATQLSPIGWLCAWTGLLSFAYGLHLRGRPDLRHAGLRTLLFAFAGLAIAAASFGTQGPRWMSVGSLFAGAAFLATAVVAGMRWFRAPRLT